MSEFLLRQQSGGHKGFIVLLAKPFSTHVKFPEARSLRSDDFLGGKRLGRAYVSKV